ncbi:MAG: Ig-like domain-containing protein, partial [Actinomycetes bacterium]
MKLSIRSAVAGASALALAGTLLVTGAGAASAATPPFDPASNGATTGSLSLFDASGNLVTSGPLNTPPKYAMANTDTGRSGAGDTLATLYAATPQQGQNALNWPNSAISTAGTYPKSSGVPANLLNKPNALVSNILVWLNPNDPGSYAAAFPNTNTAGSGWENLYQLRISTSGSQGVNPDIYSSATIKVDTTAGTWTQVYPTPASTTTTLTASPASTQVPGSNVTFTAAIAPAAAAGKVQFKDGGADLGTAQTVSNGSAALTTSQLACGPHSITAVFSPTDVGAYAGSTSNTVSYTIKGGNCPVTATTTTLSANPSSGPEYQTVTLTSTVSPSGAAGTVKFFSNGAQIGSAAVASGSAQITYNTFAAGTYTLTATFVPTDPTAFQGSSSTPFDVTYTSTQADTCIAGVNPPDAAGGPNNSSCRDPQPFKVSVPAGSLAISTPYSGTNRFDLGTMQFDPNNGFLSTQAAFPKAGDGNLTITDLRPGELGWTAYMTTSDFTSGSLVIPGTGLSFNGVSYGPNGGNALGTASKPISVSPVPIVAGGPHQFAQAAPGAS